MLCFGFSKTFLGLVMSRALYSTWNANVGVIKGTIAELSDGTNLAQMVAFVPVTWATGGTIGPLTGGFLSHPAEHFPEIFGNDFWRKYPYLLPCIVPAVVSTLCWIIVYLTLRETVRTPKSLRSLCARSASSSTDLVMAGESQESTQLLIPRSEEPKFLWELLTRLLIIAANYGLLALLDIALRTLQPVIFSTPIALGGLGLVPLSIGKVLSITGFLNGFIQLLLFARIHIYLGPKRTYITGLLMTVPVIVAFPLMNYVSSLP
ncbi:hypothetical protein H2248_008725 [Termitomyces sp. 'cryptogamus']|nr:hypothetical protein H2248_008725 [Termitomyces sp. 'cryptogamus']